jgi:AAT family amino acid transporter/aromatic amino acid transport protein AroP
MVMLILYPWNKVGLEGSPFVQIFSKMGIPAAATILNIVVLTAALSVYNSGIYSNARMLYALAQQGNAPKVFIKLNSKGIPVAGVLASSACTLIAVVLNYLVPGKVFLYLISIAVLAAVINWVMIVIANLKFRAAKGAEAEKLEFKVPGYPFANYFCIAFLLMIVGLMFQIDDMKLSLYVMPLWLAILWGAFRFKKQVIVKKEELHR